MDCSHAFGFLFLWIMMSFPISLKVELLEEDQILSRYQCQGEHINLIAFNHGFFKFIYLVILRPTLTPRTETYNCVWLGRLETSGDKATLPIPWEWSGQGKKLSVPQSLSSLVDPVDIETVRTRDPKHHQTSIIPLFSLYNYKNQLYYIYHV